MKTPIKHCWSSMMHTPEWNKMRQRNGTGTGNKQALRYAEQKRKLGFNQPSSPFTIKEAAYEKQNRKMRAEHKKDTGKTLGERQTKGTGKRRVSFACRFAGMKGSMKDKKGEPTRYAMALKKWGFGSREAARNFCNKNKEK